MTIQPGLAFSETCLQVGGRHFSFRAMGGVHIRQDAHDPLTLRAAWLALCGGLLLGLSAPILHPAGLLSGLALVTGLAGLALLSARCRPRRMELWVDYDDRPTLLFVSADRWVFHAVDRQLRRTLVEVRMQHFAPNRQVRRGSSARYAEIDLQHDRVGRRPDGGAGRERTP